MPNQRKKGKAYLAAYEWETNVDKLKKLAAEQGLTLAQLVRELTRHHIEKHGGEYYEED